MAAINKLEFCECLEVLKKFSVWENIMYKNGIDFGLTPVGDVTGKLQEAMCGFDSEWSYDSKLGFDWIIEWVYNLENVQYHTRHNKDWVLTEAGSLYDFLVFMNEHGWDD